VPNADINLSDEFPVLRQEHDIVEMTLSSVESPIYIITLMVGPGGWEAG
jgi:hypothetical protein